MQTQELNITEIERQARQMRAEAVRNTFVAFAAWVKSLVPATAGKTAH